MNKTRIEREAKQLIAGGVVDAYYELRTAGDWADFWLESKFAEGECDWSDAQCNSAYAAMRSALVALGVPA